MRAGTVLAVFFQFFVMTLGSAGQSSDAAFDGLELIGINRDTGQLSRHDFAAGTTTAVGTVRDPADAVIIGINAMTYIPKFHNL